MAGDKRSLFIRVAIAVEQSQLRLPVRRLLVVLARSADNKTGETYPGQETLAQRVGCSEKTLRALFSELDDAIRKGVSPVIVTRKHRTRQDGRGRTSDLYQLALVQPERTSVRSRDQREAASGKSRGPNGNPRTTKRKSRADQTEAASGDLSSICPEDLSSTSPAPQSSAGGEPLTLTNPEPVKAQHGSAKGKRRGGGNGKAKGRGKKGKGTGLTDPRVTELWAHYHEEFARTRGEPPVFVGNQKGAAGRAFKNMLTGLNLEQSKAAISRALDDQYTTRVQPWQILSDLNKHRGRRRSNTRAPAGQAQTGRHFDVEEG